MRCEWSDNDKLGHLRNKVYTLFGPYGHHQIIIIWDALYGRVISDFLKNAGRILIFTSQCGIGKSLWSMQFERNLLYLPVATHHDAHHLLPLKALLGNEIEWTVTA